MAEGRSERDREIAAMLQIREDQLEAILSDEEKAVKLSNLLKHEGLVSISG